jgi:hypothetical protein
MSYVTGHECAISLLFRCIVFILRELTTFYCGYVKCNISYTGEGLRFTMRVFSWKRALDVGLDASFDKAQKGIRKKSAEVNTVKPVRVLNGPFIKRNFVLNGNIFRSRDYHSIL